MSGVHAAFTCEEADNYAKVIARDGNLRVIVCRQDNQWILQKRKCGRWRAGGYFRTRSALLREWTKAAGSQLAEIEALPAYFSACKRGQPAVGGF